MSKKKRYRHPKPTFNRIFLLKQGGGEIQIARSQFELTDHVIYLLPKNQAFNASYEVGSEFFYFHFLLEDYFGHDVFGQKKGIPCLEDKPFLFSEITEGYLAQDFRGLITWQNALFSAIMYLCAPLLNAVSIHSFKSMKYHDLLIYLREHCSASLRICDLVKSIGVTRTTLSKGFKRDLGVSLKEYMIHLLLSKARELLVATDLRVSEIAFSLGYEDPFYFSRIFKNYMGETPSEYRRQTCSALMH